MATRTKIWGDFKRWCVARNLEALPAHPWTIAAYLRWVERRKGAKMARDVLNVISREHLLKSARVPERHPTVQRTMELIERRTHTRALRSNLFDDDVLAATPPPGLATDAKEDAQKSGDAQKPSRRRALASSPRLKRKRPS